MFILKANICEDASFLATILFFKKIVTVISIVIPVILVLLITIDIAKAVMASDETQMKTAQKLAIKRIIWGLVIFFVPMAITAVFSMLDDKGLTGITCYNNATDGAVEALQEAENAKLLAYEDDIQKLIDAANKSKEEKEKELERLRQIADTIKPSSDDPTGSTDLQIWFKALEDEYKWAKNSQYGWMKHPSTKNSKIKSTCATYVVVSMQRAKLIPEGKNIFDEQSGTFHINSYGKRYIKKHSDKLSYSYVNSTPKQLHKEGKLKPGDIVTFKFSPHGHTMVFVGTNKKGQLLWDTGGSTRCIKCKMNGYLNKTVNIVIRVKKAG